ncbi:hypothetical protein ACFWM1_03065 [Nocardia sp. NPDC058379]|uniref:hypothetical protein n=1 Tax=unclassified Nocardia TaxID=2637762 RepID=UPI003650B029
MLISFVIVLVLTRVFLFSDFVIWAWRKAEGHSGGRVAGTKTLLRRTSAQLEPDDQTPMSDKHRAQLAEDSRTFEIMLVGGSIGIAAWGGLFAASAEPPADRLSGLTLYLLFAGTACLLAGPLIWRARGVYLTALGRRSATELGFSLIVFSLASIVIDLRVPVAMGAALAVAGIIVVRDGWDGYLWSSGVHRHMNGSP